MYYVTSYFLISDVKSGKWAWLAMDGDPIHTTAEEQCQHMMGILTSVCIQLYIISVNLSYVYVKPM